MVHAVECDALTKCRQGEPAQPAQLSFGKVRKKNWPPVSGFSYRIEDALSWLSMPSLLERARTFNVSKQRLHVQIVYPVTFVAAAAAEASNMPDTVSDLTQSHPVITHILCSESCTVNLVSQASVVEIRFR